MRANLVLPDDGIVEDLARCETLCGVWVEDFAHKLFHSAGETRAGVEGAAFDETRHLRVGLGAERKVAHDHDVQQTSEGPRVGLRAKVELAGEDLGGGIGEASAGCFEGLFGIE